jgi:DNA-directed RNA polymerase subunit RPC12/RpoP
MASFKCSRCGKELEKLDLSRGALKIGSMPTLYKGVKCTSCDKYECMDCKGEKIRASCSFCGGTVEPAFDRSA